LSTIAAKVSVIGGPIMFVTGAERAVTISLRSHKELPFPVLASPAIAPDEVIAIAAHGVASATDTVPKISASRVGTVHMDTVPLPIVDAGGTLATPTRALWQTDTIGMKLSFGASWALR